MPTQREQQLVKAVKQNASDVLRFADKLHSARWAMALSIEEWMFQCSQAIDDSQSAARGIITERATARNQKIVKAICKKIAMKNKEEKEKKRTTQDGLGIRTSGNTSEMKRPHCTLISQIAKSTCMLNSMNLITSILMIYHTLVLA